MLPRRALPDGRIAGLCATRDVHHGLLGATYAQTQPAGIGGTVVDATGQVLPGAAITLTSQPTDPSRRADVIAVTVTNEVGRFNLDGLDTGSYSVTVELFGYARTVLGPMQLDPGQSVDVRIGLALATVSEVVTVGATTGAGQPIEKDEIRSEFLRVFQLPTDRFQEALPLLPGVVRDPRGRLSFNGTRPSQSTLLVNGTNATDPVTGQFAFELPLSAVDTVEVHAVPYSAEFGRVSGAVTEVRTKAGGATWDIGFDSLFPTPRFRGGTLMGINKATPRVKVSGPIRRGKAWLSQAFSYRLVRSQVKETIPGEDEEVVEGFDAFTQVDLELSERHSITATMSVFPTEVDNFGINSLNLADASPDATIGGWNVALLDELVTGSDTLWQSRFAVRGYDLAVRPQGAGPAQLTPSGLRGNYFNEIDRQSSQVELGLARLQSWRVAGQEHLVKIGGQLFLTSFDGIDRSGPIEVRGADGRLLKRITFRGAGVLEATDVVSSAYVQDHWRVSSRLALDLGLRYDRSAMLGESHLSPRMAFSLALDASGRTLIKGGWGLFFDQIFLQVDAFDRFQQRVEQDYGGSVDVPLGPAVVFENRVDPEGFEEPTSRVWNIEFDRELGDALLLRVNYRENRARDRLVIDRLQDATGSALVLSSTGRLTSREFDVTLRWTHGDLGDLYVSFSKIRTNGDLNDFGLIYDNLRHPLVLDNETAFQAFEVPNRLLLWGVLTLPKGFTVTPGIEWRNGFPYTTYGEDYSVIGARNAAQFPRFLSADVAVMKALELFGRQVDVGVQFYNLTNHDNPRDVVSNVASPRFGDFRNSVGTGMSLKLGLGL